MGGTQSLIDGSYEYYHYLQDRFDDSVSFLFAIINFLAVKFITCIMYLKSVKLVLNMFYYQTVDSMLV